MSARDVMLGALRAEIRRLLSQCTEEQRAIFARWTKCDIDSLSLENAKVALELCERTVAANHADAAKAEGRK